jgi:RNA polymerase sigma-70 factor, ECF subfamily
MNSLTPLRQANVLDGNLASFRLTSNSKQATHTWARNCGGPGIGFKPVEGNREESTIDSMDDLLIAVATSKDREAYQTLFEHFAPRVKSFLLGKGTSPEVAEEAVQEAMLNVWRKAGHFDPTKGAASTWIFAIARNARIDLLRKANRPALDPNDPALVPDPPTATFETVSAAQEATRIRERVAALPAEQQEVLRLAFFEDLAHTEVAQRLGIPLGTVKSRIRLAVRRIRSGLGESE